MKNLIVYQGKYGATEQYAQWLAEEFPLPVYRAESCDANELEQTGLLVMGSSVYIGKLQISRWVNKYLNQLYGKQLILFVVSGTPLSEKETLLKYVNSSLPEQITDRCRIFYLPGRLIYNKLSWKDRLLLRIASIFTGTSRENKKMLRGYDDVKKEHLAAISSEISRLLKEQQPSSMTTVIG
ncbi:flavodoxin domain-containing protein [Terrimonas ferruginea]|uniref:flavodoxin domain-containing protein n=1 Tax=Terrimonas ferruginea TaxID=249 RepID=UPI00042034DA|nr:flavodoxin domain-containing protein [Terrimonas ferruginea]